MISLFDYDPTFPHAEFRVAGIGSQDVGKTDTLIQLAELSRIPYISEGIRHVVAAMNCKSPGQVKDKTLMQWRVLYYQLKAESEHIRWLSDRSTLDNAAYWIKYHKSKASRTEFNAYMDLARENVKRYTHLLYFPILWENTTDDGFRDTDPVERRAIQAIVEDLIVKWNVQDKIIRVTKDDHVDGKNARLVEILDKLGLWLLQRDKEVQVIRKELVTA